MNPLQCTAGYSSVAVIIPALNEAASVPLVLDDLPPVGLVIVVDNRSTDNTAELAKQRGAQVVFEPRRGYGTACLAGLDALAYRIRNDRLEPRVVVFLDADYSDHPEELPSLADPILAGDFDFVLGSRTTGNREAGAMPPQSLYGNRLACFLMRWLFGVRYTDLGPFRAIRVSSLAKLNMQDRDFGWTVEMQIKAARAGLRIKEVPVSYRRRIGTSKISGTITGTFKAGYKILYTIGRYGWQSFPARGTKHGYVESTVR